MNTDLHFLIMSLAVASVGFTLWYVISTSLRLPVRYQIMYDVNAVYVWRIVRRRIYAVILYGLIPLWLSTGCSWFGPKSLSERGIHFHLEGDGILVTIVGVVFVVALSWFTSKSNSNLELYPEVRVRFWERDVLLKSGITWILYIIAYEFFYRGILLQALRLHLSDIAAVAACSALYILTHYFKLNRLTFMSMIWGVASPIIVLCTGSLMPVILIHLALCLAIEWFSILHHREMYVRRT